MAKFPALPATVDRYEKTGVKNLGQVFPFESH